MTDTPRTVLVTGASRGIGKGIALAFAKRQYNVIINYRQESEAAAAVAAEAEALGAATAVLQADVTDLPQVQQLVAQANERFGTIDVLVNNAGVTCDNLLTFMSDAEWDQVVDTSLKGGFHCAKAVVRGMARQRWGRIINVASAAALMGDVMRTNYSAAKAGLIGLTRALAREVAASQVTVNAIAPGPIETDLLADMSESKREKQLALIPLKRFGTVEEVGELVVYLASDAAGYMTGQVLSLDGGLHM